MNNPTPQGGDRSEPVTIDSIFDDPTEGDAGEGSEQVTESDTEEPIDSDGSEGEEEEATTDEESTPEESGDPKKLTAESLAKEYGLDPNNPAHRKIIDRMLEDARVRAIAEKRVADGQDYIKTLQEKISQGDYFAKLERNLFQDGKPPQQETAPRQPQQRGDRPPQPQAMQYGDGFDHWQSAEDAQKEYAKAWEEGDLRRAGDIQMALNARWFHHSVEPYLLQRIHESIESRVGPVLQKDRQLQEREAEEDARMEAIEAIKRDPDMAKLIDEMFKPDGTVEYRGQQVPGNAIWKMLKDNDWIMDIKVDGKTPREAHRATWARRYLAMARLYMREKQQATISTEKGKEIFNTGAKKAKEQAETERIRQTITKGNSKGKSRPLSDDQQFLAEISASGGTVGIPASSLFRK